MMYKTDGGTLYLADAYMPERIYMVEAFDNGVTVTDGLRNGDTLTFNPDSRVFYSVDEHSAFLYHGGVWDVAATVRFLGLGEFNHVG